MTLTSVKSKVCQLLLCSALLASIFSGGNHAAAQGLELSVTPTLFEMSAEPEQVWNSQIKVINSNKHSLTVYAEAVNFVAQGEAGHGRFLPVFGTTGEGLTLAEWVDITAEPIVVPPESSRQIPFTVRVPVDASPGGHFAAIMIGTRPPADTPGYQVATAQIVTSLFFVRIGGDVVEDGRIREFGVEDRFVPTPQADLYVRFENNGNVHVQPQGQIEIFNMWGKERGIIPINPQTHFGNVLPDSIRKFTFSWVGEPSFADIGRYKAIVTLGYGSDKRQFQSSIAHFYVIPLKATFITLLGILFTIWFVAWCVRLYVRRMLILSGIDVAAQRHSGGRTLVRDGDVLIQKPVVRVGLGPVTAGWREFRSRLVGVTALRSWLQAVLGFVLLYKRFFVAVLITVGLIIAVSLVVSDVRTPQRDYEVTIDATNNEGVKLSSEEIIYDRQTPDIPAPVIDQLFTLELINSSDQPGAAADLRQLLEAESYVVADISSDFGETKPRTVIVYPPELAETALTLSRSIGSALLSARPTSTPQTSTLITVFIGDDYQFASE